MNAICLNFKVHLPYQYKKYHFFNIGSDHEYVDYEAGKHMLRQVAQRCYMPANAMMMDLIEKYGNKVSFTFTISGTMMEMMQMFAPELLNSFKQLITTGRIELMATPYYHSLAAIKSSDEFKKQVKMHQKKTMEIFGVKPRNFINTDMVYADYIGVLLSEMGFKGAVVEGAKHVLGWRSPNYVYSNPIARNFKLLFRNQDLSDDIAIRFSNTFWTGYPLTAEKFLDWIMRDPNHRTITIAMDYRVLGDYMDTSSGIFHFFTNIPRTVFQYTDFQFLTPDEIFNKMDSVAAVYIPNETSWQAAERDTSFWLGNDLQRDFFNKLYALEEAVKYSSDKVLLNDWRRLQDADYLGDMNLRWLTEQNISNKKFSPYNAYINLVNIYNDLEMRIQQLKFSRMVVRKKMRNEKSEELVFEP